MSDPFTMASSKTLLRLSPLVSLGVIAIACGGNGSGGTGDNDASTGGSTSSTGGGWTIPTDGAEGGLGGGGGKPQAMIVKTLPAGFTVANPGSPTTSKGGYKVIGPLAEAPNQGGDNTCANVLRAVMRDFADSHADFGYGSPGNCEVEATLPASRKPVLSGTGPNAFSEWYTNVEANQPFAVDFWLEPVGDTFVFDSTSFFPLDSVGFDETAQADDGLQHRFLFTTELHTAFEYKGGETFTFRGDDDVFVFINGHLAVDLGGIHSAEEGSVDLDASKDELGIEVGKVYNFDLFQAERQPTGSNFRIETTLDFTSCGQILPGDIIK